MEVTMAASEPGNSHNLDPPLEEKRRRSRSFFPHGCSFKPHQWGFFHRHSLIRNQCAAKCRALFCEHSPMVRPFLRVQSDAVPFVFLTSAAQRYTSSLWLRGATAARSFIHLLDYKKVSSKNGFKKELVSSNRRCFL